MPEEKDKEALLPYIIAVDFDGTLVTNKFPEIGEIREKLWAAIQYAHWQGNKIILWTSRTGKTLDDAVEFCKLHGLEFDAVNENIAEVQAVGWNARKVFANIYIDDRNATYDPLDGCFKPLPTCLGDAWLRN